MSSTSLPWAIVSALKVILGEDYSIDYFEKLISRRNEVYKIVASHPEQASPQIIIAKLYHQPGIAHETSVLTTAYENQLSVPKIIGTTSNVLIQEYIEGPNLCDLINENPKPKYGRLLGYWLAQYHEIFQRNEEQVLIKGDTRIRNFLHRGKQLVGVDFEESHIGHYHEDLAVTCASILDTDPLFTKEKLKLCKIIIDTYAKTRQIKDIQPLTTAVINSMKRVLRHTANRRGKPSDLIEYLTLFEKGEITL